MNIFNFEKYLHDFPRRPMQLLSDTAIENKRLACDSCFDVIYATDQVVRLVKWNEGHRFTYIVQTLYTQV